MQAIIKHDNRKLEVTIEGLTRQEVKSILGSDDVGLRISECRDADAGSSVEPNDEINLLMQKRFQKTLEFMAERKQW